MTSTPENPAVEQLLVQHPDASTSNFELPTEAGSVVRIGRELDNEVTLIDPRSSRYHAEIRRTDDGGLEVRDVGSANGTLLGQLKLEAQEWYRLAPEQVVLIGDSQLIWEQPGSLAQTVSMAPISREQAGSSTAVPAAPVFWPWLLGLLILLALVFAAVWLLRSNNPGQIEPPPTAVAEATAPPTTAIDPTEPAADDSRNIQGQGQPTNTPQPTATPVPEPTPVRPLEPPQPNLIVERLEYLPVISGALFDPSHVYLIVQVRVENLGEAAFSVSTDQFSAQTDAGERIEEFGQQLAESEFRRLGVVNRFENLRLGAGASVAEEIIFYLPQAEYNDLTLIYQPDGLEVMGTSLGPIDTAEALALLLGTPTAEPSLAGADTGEATPTTGTLTETVAANPVTLPTPEPAPTVNRVAGRVIPSSSLVGTIAYADFNGSRYDLYFGDVTSGERTLWRTDSSQPAFSNDGQRLAYHSWQPDSRGLITSNLDQSDGFLVASFLEDQLPTWSPDDSQILFLSRRTGTRQSQLYLAPANQETPEAQLQIEGEYPTWHRTGAIVFKGWVTSGEGLRVAPTGDLNNYEPLTNNDADTSPSISPDGSQVAFMSQREGNWDIYVINIDGSNLRRITTDAADDGLPIWSPDGQAIAFVSNRGGPWAVWAMTPNGSGQRQLFTYQGSPDGFVASEPNTDTTRGWAEERLSWTR